MVAVVNKRVITQSEWDEQARYEALVNGTAALLGGSSGRLRRLQTGFVRSYALSMLLGSIFVLGALLVVRFS